MPFYLKDFFSSVSNQIKPTLIRIVIAFGAVFQLAHATDPATKNKVVDKGANPNDSSSALNGANTALASKNYNAAILQFAPLAVKGNAEAQYKMGLLNYYGLGTSSNVDKAAYWFDKAAQQNHPLAMARVAQMYLSGLGEPEDIPVALKYIKGAADQGDSEAMLIIAECLDEGCGPYDADKLLSLKWLIRADSSPLQGVGFDNDPDVAAYQKDPKGFTKQRISDVKGMIKFRLGQYFLEQQNPEDQQKALAYLEDAYNLGQKRAAFYLAAIQSGREAKLSRPEEAKKWLKQIDDEESRWLLSVLQSTKTTQFDSALKQLESRKTAQAYKDIVRLYSLGFGAYPSANQIFDAQLNAAKAGDIDSMLLVATSPQMKNEDRIVWIDKAATAGSGPAQYQLGLYYIQNGNKEKAVALLKKAAAQGYSNAEEVLKSLDKASPTAPATTQPADKAVKPVSSKPAPSTKPPVKSTKTSAANFFAIPDGKNAMLKAIPPASIDQAVIQASEAANR